MTVDPEDFVGNTTFGAVNDASRSEDDRNRVLQRLSERLETIARAMLKKRLVLRKDEDAGDIVQAVVIRVNKQLEKADRKFESKAHYAAWCFTILQNYVADRVRYQRRRIRGGECEVFSLRDNYEAIESEDVRKADEMLDEIKSALDQLMKEDLDAAEAFSLVAIDGKTEVEAGALLQVSQPTVSRRYKRAIEFLASKLE